jgi:hypothetical protein
MKTFWLTLIMCGVSLSCAASGKPDELMHADKDTTIKKDTAKPVLKPYREVITAKAITDDGLFKVHKVGDKYYFEIPDAILEKDILIVNRISKGKFDGPNTTYGGDQVGESMVRFSKGPDNKFFIKERAQDVRAADSSATGMFRAVENTNLQPIIASFDVRALSPDGKGVVLDVTNYINADNQLISIDNRIKPYLSFGLGTYYADRSYIGSIKSYPRNVEIRTVKTWLNGVSFPFTIGSATLELNCSIMLLPDQPMKPRFMDERVGYFVTGYYNFEVNKPVNIDWMIARWRLEPKEEDIEKYKRGELVEPKKPIVYFIDPATPEKWVPYLKEGVKDWQKAFEKAGFKNAIYALEVPAGDSTWSLEDAGHNVIVYKSSAIANASGPQVLDPRSGEVLETHINWYHNVQQVLHDWYMIQAGPNDSGGARMKYDDALMGRLIRYVCAHEVGHTLGLQHNFRASSSVPVDSLRSKNYVRANGFCPSIMDYARFNYVTQPEDGMDREDLIPRIGIYDEWAIEWGYKWMPDLKTRDEETTYLNNWVTSRLEKEKRLWFGAQTKPGGLNYDPLRQTEDLGDDVVKASRYGIENLKRVIAHLKDWTRTPNETYKQLAYMNSLVVSQYFSYISYVFTNIGGMQWSDKTIGQKGYSLSFPSKAVQKASVQFLHDEVFTRPSWIMNKEIYSLAAATPFNANTNSHLILYDYMLVQSLLNRVLNGTTYYNLLQAQSLDPENAYSIDELLTDFENGIWKELHARSYIDEYRRGVQKSYVQRLIDQINPDKIKGQPFDKAYADYMATTDIFPLVKAHLRKLLSSIHAAMPAYRQIGVREHLEDLSDRIRNALRGEKDQFSEAGKTIQTCCGQVVALKDPLLNLSNNVQRSCWSRDRVVFGWTTND